MPTPTQIQLIQIARRQVGLDEAAYRLILHNVAGKDSCKKLDNDGVEDVMAVFEDMGFRMRDQGGDYWRNKVSNRGARCGSRMAFKIRKLADETNYPAKGMSLRHSHGNTEKAEDLTPREGFEVIEAYKKILARQIIDACDRLEISSAMIAEQFSRNSRGELGRTDEVEHLQVDELLEAWAYIQGFVGSPASGIPF